MPDPVSDKYLDFEKEKDSKLSVSDGKGKGFLPQSKSRSSNRTNQFVEIDQLSSKNLEFVPNPNMIKHGYIDLASSNKSQPESITTCVII